MKVKQSRVGQRRTALAFLRTLVPSRPVSALRLLWVVAVVWYELGVFFWSVKIRFGSGNAPTPTHVLLVADPQVIDARSYPDRSYWLSALSQFAVDLNLRKSWAATRRFAPDVVVFLGDMMDNGRYASGDQEYREYYERFRSIFAIDPSTEVYYIPGNHDVGQVNLLGTSRSFSPQSRKRYTTNFGPLNYKVSVANHTLVMVDAPGLVEEDYRRTPTGQTFEDWTPPPGGATDFINKFASDRIQRPVALSEKECSTLADAGLKHSGDDHDYCEYMHSTPLLSEGPEPNIQYVREVTVKSISIAMGIQRPGFQLLSLVSPSELTPNAQSFADTLCLLPDQLSIYLNRYVPLLIISLLVLGIFNYRGLRSRKTRPTSLDIESDLTPPLSLHAPPAFDYHHQTSSGGTTKSSVPSPESAPMSYARTPRNMATGAQNGTQFAPTYRASNYTTPNTPDFNADGVPVTSANKISTVPARLRAPDSTTIDIHHGDDDDDDDDHMSPVQYASRHAGGGGSDYFALTSGRPGRG
ncbi:hypothetical protein EW145_g2951, partial [Phellinidium pouzarii]